MIEDAELRVEMLAKETVTAAQVEGFTLDETRDVFLRELFKLKLQKHGNNQCSVAASEGMHRNTLGRLLRELKVPMEKRWKQYPEVKNEANIS